jgi:glutaredoxin
VIFIKIILYSNNCPKCKILKSKLDEKKIEYEIFNDINIMIKKGFRSLPILEVNGENLDYLKAINFIKNN